MSANEFAKGRPVARRREGGKLDIMQTGGCSDPGHCGALPFP